MEQQQKMMRISVEVRSGTARFRVGVQAPSIRHALSMVAGRYPRGEVGVAFPIEPEAFFVSEPAAPARIADHEPIQKEAA
jgi:hypothetical protein